MSVLSPLYDPTLPARASHLFATLHAARLAQRVSIRALSRLSRVPLPSTSHLCHGTSPQPGAWAIARIAEVLGLSTDDLLSVGRFRETQPAIPRPTPLDVTPLGPPAALLVLREARGLSRAEVAELAGVSCAQLAALEAGVWGVDGLSSAQQYALAALFGVPIAALEKSL